MKVSHKLDTAETYIPEQSNCKIYLNANESFVPLDKALKEACDSAIYEASLSLNRYPDAFSLGLCRAFSTYYGIDERFVSAANGSDESIAMLYSCLLDAEDTVMTLERDFAMYRISANTHNLKVVSLAKDEDTQRLSADEVIKKANETSCNMLIFSNPCNPTGQVFKRDEVIKIVEHIDALVVVDEAYMDFSHESVIELAGSIYENLIVLRTASKAFGMAGIRLGMQVASLDITRRLKAGKLVFNVNSFAQKIGEAIYQNKASCMKAIEEIKASTVYLYGELCKLSRKYDRLIRVYPTEANFIFMKAHNAKGLFDALKEKGIMTRDFGKDYFRVCAGTESENQAFLKALEDILESE